MTETTTGTEVIREALRARNATLNLGGFARDIGLASDRLEQFILGRTTLPVDVLQALTKELFSGHAVWDVKIDRLRSANQAPPIPMGIHPPPITETMTLPTTPADRRRARPGCGDPSKPKAPRAGWVE